CPDINCANNLLSSSAALTSFGMVLAPDSATQFTGIQRFINAESSGSEIDGSALTPEQHLILEDIMITAPQFARAGVFNVTPQALVFGSAMARLRVPVLVQHGADDALVSPSVISAEQAVIRQFSAKLYPKSGHIPFILSAAAFNRDLLEWLI